MNRFLHEVELNCLDVSNLMWDIQQTCVTNEDIEHLWEIKQVWLVKNKDLEDRYDRKRKLMKSLGRTEEETKDDLLFMAEGFNNVQRLCQIGPRCREKKNNVLGDTQYGIHMNRHYDILTRFMVFKNFQQANYLVILRGMLGRVKKVKPFFSGEYGCIAPTPNYDCHLAENSPDLTSIDISDAIAYNFAYMYEYDEETIIPMEYPSHVLPIAVLRLHRTRNRLDRTVLLNYTRERDLSMSKKVPRLKNETKPLKLLPRAAPHKKYIVEGRRSGTRLISDVPIEPPSTNTHEETMKKLEKFRRPSALSGGTGMGYMFFKRPFNKMPTTWQRMFRFSSKRGARSFHTPRSRRRSRSRSRSPNREYEKRRRSRSKSPKPSGSRPREKNLFELFDNTKQDHTTFRSYDDIDCSDDVTKHNSNGVFHDKNSSVSCVDTGCQTGDQRSTGNSTPTQDEPQCTDTNITVSSAQEYGREMYTETGFRHNPHLTKMCVDQKSQTIDDSHCLRSQKFSNGCTPERKASVHESTCTDIGKTACVGTKHTDVLSKEAGNDMTYQLVRITLDEPNTPSIYHKLRGITIPSGEKKTVKDPRLLRAMGHVVETPVMAGFGPFLRRIKDEPPDDENYGERQEKMTKNILPLENIKTEPQHEHTEDDVEKVLLELNNAIRAMQDNTLGDMEVVSIKNEPKERDSGSDGNNKVEDQADKHCDKDEDQENNSDNFHPRNMGFSSYLPEYNDDFERTARVLTEVFNEKEASPTKKVHMSMSDYFGITNPSVSVNSTNDEGNIEGKLSDINSEPTRSVQVPKETVEKKEESKSNEKEVTETKHSTKQKKDKHKNKVPTTKLKANKLKKSAKKRSNSGKLKSEISKFNSNEELVVTINRSRSRSVKSRSGSRSPSTSFTRTRQPEVTRKRSRSRSLSKFDRDRGRTRSKSPQYKRQKQEKYFSRSPSADRTSFRGRPESHHSRERKRSPSPFCSRSTSSHDSGSKSKYTATSGFSKTSKDSKYSRRSLAEEIFERENSPGRLKYLEERKKIDIKTGYVTTTKYHQDDMTRSHHSSSMVFANRHMGPDDNLSLYDNHRSSYVDLTKESEISKFSERKATSTNDEAVVNTTLSKAMTSLLKKIVFRDNSNQDDSAEGRMADMVIELVKDQMSKELKSELKPSAASPSAQSEHPFVPYLKQERSVESLYSSNPWHSSMSNSARQESPSRGEFRDEFMDTQYQKERAESGSGVSYSSRGRYMQQGHSQFSQPDQHSGPSHSSFRGKLLSVRTIRKMRGSSYRGGLTFYRGGFQTRGFRGGFRARGRGHSKRISSSYRYNFKDKHSYNKR